MKVMIGKDILLNPVGTRARGWGWERNTRAAIEWLEANVEPGMTVADIGTGTGVLALVAARLGGIVTAYESNEDVRDIATCNFRLNGTDIALYGKFVDAIDGCKDFDLVVANLGDIDYGDILTAGRKVWTSGKAT